MAGPTALTDALADLQGAFAAGARRRLALVRRLARLDVGAADADALRALAGALLRREAADADEAAMLEDRVVRVAAEVGAAGAARERLAGHPDVQAVLAEIDATWQAALDRSAALAGWLEGRADTAAVAAFAGYVAALRALHALDPATPPAELAAAAARLEAALAHLSRAVGAPPA